MKYQIISICLICALKITGQESALLDTNDVSARIYADGRLFNGFFEVPKGSGFNTINQLSIWVGGYDQASNIHFAAQSDGKTPSEFGYGPIATDYNDSTYIHKYNRVWKVNSSEIEFHRSNYKNPAYIVPASITNWPGNGNTSNGEAVTLAPFIDENFNDIYDPENGDYPLIKGDQAVFFIINDQKLAHTQTNGDPIWVEIHGMAYAYASLTDTALRQTIFLHLQFINRAPQDLLHVCIGLLADMNIGNSDDDYIGSDSDNDLVYTYNSKSSDQIYGEHPPAQGCQIFDYGALSEATAHKGLINFNDNKHNEPIGTGPPVKFVEYYRYLTGLWKDATPLTRGNLGYNPGSVDSTKYVFDGDPTDSFGNGWTEIRAGNIAGDRICLKILGPFLYFIRNSSICVSMILPYARDYEGDNLSAIKLLRKRVKAIEDFHEGTDFHYSCFPTSTNSNQSYHTQLGVDIYPNPNVGNFNIELNSEIMSKNAKIEIYNAFAQRIYKSSIPWQQKTKIDISSQPGGIYFAKIFDGKKWTSKKLIIQ